MKLAYFSAFIPPLGNHIHDKFNTQPQRPNHCKYVKKWYGVVGWTNNICADSIEKISFGGIFLILQVLVLARNFIIGYIDFYWFCDFAPMVFAVFFFCNAPQGAKGLIHIGLLGQLLYTVSFLSAVLFAEPLFGFPIDLTLGTFSVLVTFVMHQSAMLALFATRRIPASPRSLLYSAIILLGVYVAVLSLADPTLATQENYNYIYSGSLLNFIPFYTELWIGIAMCVAVLPAFAFEKIPDALLLLVHRIRRRYAASS